MKADIILVTYNHSRFVQEALAGIAKQQYSFTPQIIVADDFSADGTLNIIKDYIKSLHYEVKILHRERNLGILKNYKEAFSMTGGDYIFILEGDDYWTDPLRLQKHVDFMDSNPECVMTMNRFTEYWQEKNEYHLPDWPYPEDYAFITTRMLAGGNRLGNLSACCIRTSAWRKIEKGIFDIPVADWMIGMALGEYGSIALLKEPMSVYRKSATGLWSGMNPDKEKAFLLELIDIYDRYLGFRYHKEFEAYKMRIRGISKKNESKGFFNKILSRLEKR
jgi:glycosyltransferase involved in cell wall biosynthesis